MVHEATAESGRLKWMTERHVRPLYDAARPLWRRLRAAGIAAPIDHRLFHYVMVGAASLVYVNALEARLLTGIEPTADKWVETHAAGLVAMLLPNAAEAHPGTDASGKADARGNRMRQGRIGDVQRGKRRRAVRRSSRN